MLLGDATYAMNVSIRAALSLVDAVQLSPLAHEAMSIPLSSLNISMTKSVPDTLCWVAAVN